MHMRCLGYTMLRSAGECKGRACVSRSRQVGPDTTFQVSLVLGVGGQIRAACFDGASSGYGLVCGGGMSAPELETGPCPQGLSVLLPVRAIGPHRRAPGPTTQAATEFGFANHRDLQEPVCKKHCGIAGSQAVEDSFNYMKNGRMQKGKKKFRKPAKVFSSVLFAEVMSRVHKCKEVMSRVHKCQLSATIPRQVVQPGRTSASGRRTWRSSDGRAGRAVGAACRPHGCAP